MSDLFVRERPVKKHTRSVKETLIIYAIGVFVCVYLGFLLGAVWMDGNNLNEFMNNHRAEPFYSRSHTGNTEVCINLCDRMVYGIYHNLYKDRASFRRRRIW